MWENITFDQSRTIKQDKFIIAPLEVFLKQIKTIENYGEQQMV